MLSFIFSLPAIIFSEYIKLPNSDFKSLHLNEGLYYTERSEAIDLPQDTSLAGFASLKPQNEIKEGWLYFKLSNTSKEEKQFYLEITNTVFFDRIQLFEKKKHGLISLGIEGDPVHHSLRPTKDHEIVFRVTLPTNSTIDYFMYMKSPYYFHPSLELWNEQSFNSKNDRDNLFYFFMHGVILFATILSFFLALIFKKERIYIFYTLYLISITFLYLHYNDIGYKIIWPNWPEFDMRLPFVASSLSMIFLLKFSEIFLTIDKLKPWVRKHFNFAFYAFCLSAILSQIVLANPVVYKAFVLVFIALLNVYFFFSCVGCFHS